jgi:hypothetical protein
MARADELGPIYDSQTRGSSASARPPVTYAANPGVLYRIRTLDQGCGLRGCVHGGVFGSRTAGRLAVSTQED